MGTTTVLTTFICFLQLWLLSILSSNANSSQHIIKSIPGFPGTLPFYLQTGYVGVGKDEEVQLFYYFIKSESDPQNDPLMVWITGGPGCSALSGIVIEVGPLLFNTSACNWQSEFPVYQTNPFSWTKVASIIFLDAPVGTGFSYSTKQEGYYADDITSSKHIYQFLCKWLMDHTGFQNNPLYVSGDSYSGKIVPIAVQEILDGNKAGIQPIINLQGYILGNPYTWKIDDYQGKYNYAHRVSFLSDELYQSTKMACNGTYENLDSENVICKHHLQAVSNNIDPISKAYILNPKCISDKIWCQTSIYVLLHKWANDIQVQEALHVRQGMIPYWTRCNNTIAYEKNVESTLEYHQNHTQEFMHALIYNGDQDIFVSYVGTLEWIQKLNISITQHWRPWFENNQVAGYTMSLSNERYHLTYATVKGAGHTAPEYKRLECLTMLMKFLQRVHSSLS